MAIRMATWVLLIALVASTFGLKWNRKDTTAAAHGAGRRESASATATGDEVVTVNTRNDRCRVGKFKKWRPVKHTNPIMFNRRSAPKKTSEWCDEMENFSEYLRMVIYENCSSTGKYEKGDGKYGKFDGKHGKFDGSGGGSGGVNGAGHVGDTRGDDGYYGGKTGIAGLPAMLPGSSVADMGGSAYEDEEEYGDDNDKVAGGFGGDGHLFYGL